MSGRLSETSPARSDLEIRTDACAPVRPYRPLPGLPHSADNLHYVKPRALWALPAHKEDPGNSPNPRVGHP